MRKTGFLTIALALAIATVAQGQDTTARGYRSFFGTGSTEWFYCEPLLSGGSFSYRIAIGADTIINDISYKQIQKFRLNVLDTTDMDGFEYDDGWAMFVREDTTTGRLWYRTNDEEVLLADMSLQVGDTFNGHVVQSVEYDSLGRKKILMGWYYDFPNYFMQEGVGPNILFGYPNLLICVFHDGENVYKCHMDDTFHGCPVSSEYCRTTCDPMGTVIVDNSAPLVFPNPCYSFFCVESSDESQVSMYDVLGHIILQKETCAGKEIIDVASKPVGVYYIYIASHSRANWFKIIKK